MVYLDLLIFILVISSAVGLLLLLIQLFYYSFTKRWLK